MSTGSTLPFAPSGTITIAAGAVSVFAPLSPGDTVLIFNAGTAVAFVAFGNGGALATTAGFPVPAGGSRLLYIGPIVNTVAAVGTGAVYVSCGTGTVY